MYKSDLARVFVWTCSFCLMAHFIQLFYLLAFHQYACVSDITLPNALKMELKGDIEDCLIDIGR